MGPQYANPKIAKRLQITNQQITTFATGPANLTNLESAQVGGFAICGTYLRTAHL
jgi:hypothetical protein